MTVLAPSACRILVAAGRSADADAIRSLLAPVFANIDISTKAEQALADFQASRPAVLVLAFDSLAKAQGYVLGLAGSGQAEAAPACARVLLCASDGVAEAFELCKGGDFDDYVPYWPQPPDSHRLLMAVWNAARGHAAPAPADRPVVLVVEDDAFAAQLVGNALEDQGYDIEFVDAAPAMMAWLRLRKPALILMDVKLPGMDGLALTEWLKASPSLSHIPVLMMTSGATREAIARSKAVGAAGFIVKPFIRDALVAKVAHHLP